MPLVALFMNPGRERLSRDEVSDVKQSTAGMICSCKLLSSALRTHDNLTNCVLVMTPFAGVGVNCALTDAMVLAKELVSKKDSFVAKAFSHRQNISSAVRKYETAMFEFSKDYAEKTAQGLKGHFSKDGAKDRADMFLKLLEKKTGKKLDKDVFN